MSNLDTLSLRLSKPNTPTEPSRGNAFVEHTTRVSGGMLRTIWDYCEQTPKALFLYCDYSTGATDALIVTQAQELIPVKGYKVSDPAKDTPERYESLQGYLREDLAELQRLTVKCGKVAPARAWFAMDILNDTVRTVFGYRGEALTVEEALEIWRKKIVAQGWQNLPL